MGILIILIGILLLAPAWRLRRGHRLRRLIALALLLTALPTLAAGTYWTWFTHRRQPPAVIEDWYEGVRYQREVFQQPRPIVAHIVTVDLHAPGIKLLFTPPPDMSTANTYHPMLAQTTSSFARASNAQVAINGSFFYPFHAKSPFNYYPHEGNNVQAVGITAWQGIVYQRTPWQPATLYVTESGDASFTFPGSVYNALSGNVTLVDTAKNIATDDPVDHLYPRTAIGLDRDRRTLILVVVDGKQPSYSEGATLPELADILIRHGAFTAINLDGGGSSTLVHQTGFATWTLVNSTSNFRMPWWERPIANHLGIQASGTK